MSTSALITMILAWTVIAYYTIKFFIKVLKTPPSENSESYSDSDTTKK